MRIVIRELFETVILALLIFLGLQFSMGNYKVEGSSMVPTLEEGEYVIVNKLVYLRFDPREIVGLLPFVDSPEKSLYPFHAPNRGDVIIFEFPPDPDRDFVKRVIGLPGDTVELQRGQVLVNGIALSEPYITRTSSDSMREIHVPPDNYFVLGDNRGASHDSRNWGPVPAGNIIGRAWVSFWPLNSWHTLSGQAR